MIVQFYSRMLAEEACTAEGSWAFGSFKAPGSATGVSSLMRLVLPPVFLS